MPRVSVIVPIYNVEQYVAETIRSVLAQTYSDFELLLIDDGSPDRSVAVCAQFTDPRIRLIRQANRGLAGARNTGIREATGEYLAFLDSDDLWVPEKLARHVAHLDSRPEVGVSYARSAFIDEQGRPLNAYQMPKLTGITTPHLLCRNPVGNGSAPVIRHQVFEDIRFRANFHGAEEDCYFDDRFRQSEDIECWIRISIQTQWQFEGLPEALTLYRVNDSGLSANLFKQLDSWEKVIEKTRSYAPDLIARHGNLARAYQLRYLARRAVRLQDPKMAVALIHRALATDPRMLIEEPKRTLLTLAAAYMLVLLPRPLYQLIEKQALRQFFNSQRRLVPGQ